MELLDSLVLTQCGWCQDELDEEFQKRLVEHKEAAVTRTEKKRAKRLVYYIRVIYIGLSTRLLNHYYTRGVQKVHSLTQLAMRYAHHNLSLFNIVTCN